MFVCIIQFKAHVKHNYASIIQNLAETIYANKKLNTELTPKYVDEPTQQYAAGILHAHTVMGLPSLDYEILLD